MSSPTRAGPNRNMILLGRPHAGKTTFAFGLALDPTDTRYRWVAHMDGDESASSVAAAFADPSIARHYPLDLDEQQWRREILGLIPAVASGECGAVIVEGLAPLYTFYAGENFGNNPEEAEKGGNATRLLYAMPAAKLRSVHSAITRLYQAAPKDSGFVMCCTMHMKNVGDVGKAPNWVPRVSSGVWDEFFAMTPIVLELSRTGDGAPYLEWNDVTNSLRRIKNAAAKAAAEKARAEGRALKTIQQFLDTIRGAEQWQRNAAKAKEAAQSKAAAAKQATPAAPVAAPAVPATAAAPA